MTRKAVGSSVSIDLLFLAMDSDVLRRDIGSTGAFVIQKVKLCGEAKFATD